MLLASGPLIRIKETAPVPGGVAIAAIVEFSLKMEIECRRHAPVCKTENCFDSNPKAIQDARERMLIKELPEDERPREKLVERGPAALSDAEILAVFFGTGRKGMSAVDLGREMISRFGSLRNLSRASLEELTEIEGIGPAKAAQLAAVFEFGHRLAKEPYSRNAIQSPEDAFALIGPEMQRLSQESVRVILLNHKKCLIHISEVFVGTQSESFANPAEILRKAISHAASSIILAHNHPTGDPTPSHADKEVTERLAKACDAVGIELTDHIIIGCHSDYHTPYYSFREAGII